MQKIHAEAKQSLEKAADQMKAQYNKKKHPAVEYQVGDKVWLDTTNLNLPRPKKKLADKRTGPFKIVDEPPGSVRSEFADLAIHHPIPSKRHHYNPHTLDNTTAFRSIGHKHSDTVLKP